ncbi:MAG: hypothetical protein ACOX1U_01355 [Saccharofermentanales bacterium]|nr:hypothetical protein [Clostridiaceae bacterium]
MLSAQLIKLARDNDWKVHADEQTVFGEYNGYLFTGLEGKRFKAFITSLAGISPDALQSLIRFLDENFDVLRLRNYDFADNFLCVRIREGLLPLTTDRMAYILGQISGMMSLGDLPADACAVCGDPAKSKGLYHGLYCHLHPTCLDQEPTDFVGSNDCEEENDYDSAATDDESVDAVDDRPKADPDATHD